MRSTLYRGWVEHHRRSPREHRFRYAIGMLGLDLDHLPETLRHPWCGHRRPALVRYHRGDYFGDRRETLARSVRRHVRTHCGIAVDGPIRLVTTLRSFGIAFNPVSFYLCHDAAGDLRCILAEITNTPWRERCVYALGEADRQGSGPAWTFRFDKRFHISPFMPMDQGYEWTFRVDGPLLAVHMRVLEDGEERFCATMSLRGEPLTAGGLTRHLAARPVAPLQVLARIYWQALRLWLKRVPVHDHPDTHRPPSQRDRHLGAEGGTRSALT